MFKTLVYFVVIGVRFAISDVVSSNYFCADMNPQPHVLIDQLMGMWYGIEIISHSDEQHYVKLAPSCPVIHISEDKSQSTTYNPLHKSYNYGYNYGENNQYNHRTQYGRTHQQDYANRQPVYETKTSSYNYNNRRYGSTNDYIRRQNEDFRHLRLWWDENGSNTEYNLRYNVSQAGFWISSGPQNGSSLAPQFSHFAGTVQVIKAVGNHLVLTFCHQLPDKQLYSVLLARENKLDSVDIHGVHNLLNRKGLSTNAIKKVCNSCYRTMFSASLLLVTYFLCLYF